jgi:hypothetical protein
MQNSKNMGKKKYLLFYKLFQLLKLFLFKNFFERIIFIIGSSHILKIRNNYKDIKSINDLDFKIFSQNGEDGIIDYLLHSLNIFKAKFVEIGIGNYSESNTRFLYENHSGRGLVIDCLKDLKNKISKNIKLWKGDLTIVETMITSENIRDVLKKNNFNNNIDLFSLDIDGIDYWVINELDSKISKIFVAEYNPVFGDIIEVTVPNIKDFNRKKYHYSNLCFGMSLKALIRLMNNKGFYFIGTNKFQNNAFFINNDYPKEKYFPKIIIEPLNFYLQSTFRESRDADGMINLLNKNDALKNICDCEVVDLSTKSCKIKKISDFFTTL